jgi:hypothetical protein
MGRRCATAAHALLAVRLGIGPCGAQNQDRDRRDYAYKV